MHKAKKALDYDEDFEEKSKLRKMSKLMQLIAAVNKERWCSHIITLESFDDGFSAIAEIFNHAGSQICSEISKYLIEILPACRKENLTLHSSCAK